jgi:hypothetical protein
LSIITLTGDLDYPKEHTTMMMNSKLNVVSSATKHILANDEVEKHPSTLLELTGWIHAKPC